MQSSANVNGMSEVEKRLAGLLGVILSGKSSSVRMRVKNIRKPVVDQSEVMVRVESTLQL